MKKTISMLSMIFMLMAFLPTFSFADDAKAPAAAQAPASAVVIPSNAAPQVVKSPDAAAAAMEPKSSDQQVVEITTPPDWLKTVIAVVMKMPYVGPILIQIMQWMGVLAAVLTALAGLMLALMQILNKMGKSVAFLLTIKGWLDKAYPYVAWLSMLNVSPAQAAAASAPKPDDKKPA